MKQVIRLRRRDGVVQRYRVRNRVHKALTPHTSTKTLTNEEAKKAGLPYSTEFLPDGTEIDSYVYPEDKPQSHTDWRELGIEPLTENDRRTRFRTKRRECRK